MILNYIDKLIQEVIVIDQSSAPDIVPSEMVNELPKPHLDGINDPHERELMDKFHNATLKDLNRRLNSFVQDNEERGNTAREAHKILTKYKDKLSESDHDKYIALDNYIKKINAPQDNLENERSHHQKELHDAVERQKYIGLGLAGAVGLGGYALGRKKKS